MTRIRARVVNGRLTVDQPTNLPEGTVLDLVLDDEGDDLDEGERARRDASIERGWEEAKAGRVVDAAQVLDRMKPRG